MGSMIYTVQRSRLTKTQKAKRKVLLKEQRTAKKEMLEMKKGPLNMADMRAEESRRYREMYPSLDSESGLGLKKESPQYTGDLLIGIATMHKSNAVPVLKQEDAEDLARMNQ